jgi:hypothetical protein
MGEVEPLILPHCFWSAEIIRAQITVTVCREVIEKLEFFNVLPIPTGSHPTIGQQESEKPLSALPDT